MPFGSQVRFEARHHRMLFAEILLDTPLHERCSAEKLLNEAMQIAQDQNALSWSLRVAITQAGMLLKQGNSSKARDILAPMYDRFDQRFMTFDLVSAKQLLDSIG